MRILCDTYLPLITELHPTIFRYAFGSNGDLYGYFDSRLVIMIDLERKTYSTLSNTVGKTKVMFYNENLKQYCEKQKEVLDYVDTHSKKLFKSYGIRQGLRAAPKFYDTLGQKKQSELAYQKSLYNERKKEVRKCVKKINEVSVFLNGLGYKKR